MGIVVPDIACLREPNLLIPGKKPVGNVVPDPTHPFTPEFLILPPSGEHIHRLSAVNDSATSSKYIDFRSTTAGLGFYFDGTHYAYISVPSELMSYTRYTLILQFRLDELTTNRLLYQTGDNNASYDTGLTIWADNSGYYSSNTNCLSIQVENCRLETDTNSIQANKIHTVVFSYIGSTKATCYVDGKLVLSTSTGYGGGGASISIPASVSFTSVYMRIGGYGDTLLASQIGHTMLVAASRQTLSDAECKGLSVDPYQFLIPA